MLLNKEMYIQKIKHIQVIAIIYTSHYDLVTDNVYYSNGLGKCRLILTNKDKFINLKKTMIRYTPI